jgi:hypothetical protein
MPAAGLAALAPKMDRGAEVDVATLARGECAAVLNANGEAGGGAGSTAIHARQDAARKYRLSRMSVPDFAAASASGAPPGRRCLIFAGMRGEDGGGTGAEREMSLALLLAFQAAPQAPVGPLPIDFDLAALKPGDPCRTGGGGGSDIVVCGRRSGDFDYEKWERVFRTGPLLAERSIGPGAVARAYVESVEMPQGQISKRAMVGVKVKF